MVTSIILTSLQHEYLALVSDTNMVRCPLPLLLVLELMEVFLQQMLGFEIEAFLVLLPIHLHLILCDADCSKILWFGISMQSLRKGCQSCEATDGSLGRHRLLMYFHASAKLRKPLTAIALRLASGFIGCPASPSVARSLK
jgi:hypothetical protein